jgi:hypothetical protein
MRALSIMQPWAGAILELGKDIENRSWGTRHHGVIALHAGLKLDGPVALPGGELELLCGMGPAWVRGAVVGVAELVECTRDHASKWAVPGAVHWVLRSPITLPMPVPCKGSLGLWVLPADVEAAVLRQLDLAKALPNPAQAVRHA